MLSKGGKIEYKCPFCHYTGIERVYVNPTWAVLLREGEHWTDKEWDEYVRMDSNHGECSGCNSWFPWSDREKHSLKKRKEK